MKAMVWEKMEAQKEKERETRERRETRDRGNGKENHQRYFPHLLNGGGSVGGCEWPCWWWLGMWGMGRGGLPRKAGGGMEERGGPM